MCKILGLQLLLFVSYYGKNNMGGKITPTQIRVKIFFAIVKIIGISDDMPIFF